MENIGNLPLIKYVILGKFLKEKEIMEINKKVLALILSLTMVVSLFTSTTAFASGENSMDSGAAAALAEDDVHSYEVGPTNCEAQMPVNDRRRFHIEGVEDTLTWSITRHPKDSTDGIVSISKNGVITALKAGRTLLTATDEKDTCGKSYYVLIEVYQVPEERKKLLINYDCSLMFTGEKRTIVVRATGESDSVLSYKWTSSDKQVISVDNSGTVTAKALGTATITVSVKDNKNYEQASIDIVVRDKKEKTASFSYDNVTYTPIDYRWGEASSSQSGGHTKISVLSVFKTNASLDSSRGFLYLKVPIGQNSEFHGYTGETRSSYTVEKSFFIQPVSATANETVIKIPLSILGNVSEFEIQANNKTNSTEKYFYWNFRFNKNTFDEETLLQFPMGTYRSAFGSIISIDKSGKFTLDGNEIKENSWVSDSYGFDHQQYLSYSYTDGNLSKISAQTANINATDLWLANKDDTIIRELSYDSKAKTLTDSDGTVYKFGRTTDDQTKAAQDAISALPNGSATLNDGDKEVIVNVVKKVFGLNHAQQSDLGNAAIEKLGILLRKITDGTVTKTVNAITVDSSVKDSNKISETPSISGLLVAAGITGEEKDKMEVKLGMEQVSTTVPDAVLALKLSLSKVIADKIIEIHTLNVPVQICFRFPKSFENDSKSTYKILHQKSDGTEELPLQISYDRSDKIYSGMFTTSSLSTFTVIKSKSNSSSNSGSSSGSGSGSGFNSGFDFGSGSSAQAKTFVSDTVADFNVKGEYQFKITSTNGQIPTLVVGTASIFNTQLVKVSGNDYYFKLIATGNPGTRSGIYVNGVKLLVATVAANSPTVKCDTSHPFKVKAGNAYTFKLTAESKPTFVVGTSSAFKTEFVKAVGKDYFFKVTAVGEAGITSGFYINSQKTPVTIVTISK